MHVQFSEMTTYKHLRR